MADNYLENKMEEHRKGGGLPKTGFRKSPLSYAFPQRKFFVTGLLTPLAERFLTTLANDGMKIALLPNPQDNLKAESLRQKTGIRVFPELPDLQDVAYKWRGIDVLAVFGEDCHDIVSRLRAVSLPAMDLKESMAVLRIEESDAVVSLCCTKGSIENATGIVKSSLAAEDAGIVKLIKWMLSPENEFLCGTEFEISRER